MFLDQHPFTFALLYIKSSISSPSSSLLLSQCFVLHLFAFPIFIYSVSSSLRSLPVCCAGTSLLIKASNFAFVTGCTASTSLPIRHGLVEFLNNNIFTFYNVWLPNVTSTSANPRMSSTSLPSAVTALILDLSYGLISMFRILATSSLITEIGAPVSGMYCIAMLFSNSYLCLLPLFGMSKALNVIVLDFCGNLVFRNFQRSES